MARAFLFVFVLALAAGCATTEPGSPPPEPGAKAPDAVSITGLLRRAEFAEPRDAAGDRLAAAGLAMDGGDTELALRVLAMVEPTHLDSRQVSEFLLLSARAALVVGNPRQALSYLNDARLRSQSSDRERQILIGMIRSAAYHANRSYIASARERIYLDEMLTDEARADNHDQIFATLLQVNERSLAQQAERAITADLRGWLSLAAMTRRFQDDPLRQLEELDRWKLAWPNHPAAARLPRSLSLLSRIVTERPDRIALLLPLSGELSTIGRAIRDGFLVAHYEQRNTTPVDIYDTTGRDIALVVAEAESRGADLIVGPLSKENVTRLADGQLRLPVLGLNRTSDGETHPDLYQFGLAPEDEISQISRQVASEGLENALVLFPNSEWGNRSYDSFRQSWLSEGGNIIQSAAYSDQRDYSDVVKSLLGVDRSEERAQELQRILGRSFEFTPRRRQDIDFVLLLANPVQARGINPALERYYADDVPVYATSHVHEYGQAWIDAIDLNRIRFCDMPWKLADSDPLQQKIQAEWELSRGTLGPFFALGADAHRLYPRLQQLKEIRSDRIYGATGVLSLNPSNVIERQLQWAQFRDGEAIANPMVVAQ